jgi:hypothetical protein
MMPDDSAPTRVAPFARASAAFYETAKDRNAEWNGQPHRDFCVRIPAGNGLVRVTVPGKWPDIRLYSSAQTGNGWEPVTDPDGKPTGDVVVRAAAGSVQCLGVPTGDPTPAFEK